MTEQELYDCIIKKYGWRVQFVKAQEEAAEFIQAISKFLISGSYEDMLKVIEEGTDNEIMTSQVKLVLPFEELWNEYKEMKLNRIRKYITQR
jgi:hypothetical protein